MLEPPFQADDNGRVLPPFALSPDRLVAVPVVDVRKVRVPVREGLMPVFMAVGLTGRVVRPMRMLMVFVMPVPVPVLMLNCVVKVLMFMALGQMQPESKRHESACNDETEGQWLVEERQREHCADEGGEGKISSRSRSSKMA
jgi:hypothetical protein